MKIDEEARSTVLGVGILRLRRVVRFANHSAALKMTVAMVALAAVGLCGVAFGTNYYVSSSSGSDLNAGMSPATAWQTVAHVNAQALAPGDSVLFKRGDVWNESLVPPSSGKQGNPIVFDAYGTGPAPNLTGYFGILASSWIFVTGNAWKVPVPATFTTINFCLFGSVWGQKVGASSSNLTALWDFYFANGYLYVYAQGNGLSLRFYLSQSPFPQTRPALIDEEYAGSAINSTKWAVDDPTSAISLVAQTLQVQGGTGRDGQTTVCFREQIELGGALELQHGDIRISGPSQGVLGGLYVGGVSIANCLAGFQVTPNGSGSRIQALINGVPTGPTVGISEGHRYVLTTYLYSREVYRSEETYHSSEHPAGRGWGGAAVPADVRFVLQVQDVNPSNPGSLVAPATVLYDGVVQNAPAFCTYALVNANNLQCSIAFTYGTHISLAEVRTALPNTSYATVPVGRLSDGAQCAIVSSTTLDFYPQYVPPLNTLIVASYRGYGRAVAEVANSASIAGLAQGVDDGVRGLVRTMKTPSARTQADCENAALAILDDTTAAAWEGSYETWSDYLPAGADDVFPGDGIELKVPSRGASFEAIVRRVGIDLVDPAGDRGVYTIEFANDAAQPLAYQDEASATMVPLQDLPPKLTTTQVGQYFRDDLSEAQVVQVTSTTVSIDAGVSVPNGCGIEVRLHDFGWGISNDRNLLGRFNTQSFTLPRLARTQNYFLRLYDSSSPPRYSRYAAALHVDLPL